MSQSIPCLPASSFNIAVVFPVPLGPKNIGSTVLGRKYQLKILLKDPLTNGGPNSGFGGT
jgi:hypothetical protein